ncbi:MAG: hypothetical protein WDO15_03435 [Bacteroidota bacterium]
MIKRIFGCLVVLATFIISCKEDDGRIVNTFSAQAEATNTSISLITPPTGGSLVNEKYKVIMMYSLDGGNTWVDYPLLKPGDSYKAKVVYRPPSGTVDLSTDACYHFDWSTSVPAPTSTSGDVADFVMQNDNAIAAIVSDYTAYSAGTWTGAWIGTENGACCSGDDPQTMTADPADPNKITMDNWWADGVDVTIMFTPSTGTADQTISIPTQTTSENGVASGTGTYDQCRGVFTLAAKYVIGGKTYTWSYEFAKDN